MLLFSDLLNQKYLAAFYSYLFYLAFDLSIYYNFIHVRLPILRRRYPKRIDNPFYTLGCEYLLFVCRCCLRCFAWFSYWFDNLGFFTEGNTYRRCAASSLPLWGNTDVVLADRSFSGAIVREQSEGISSTVVGEDLLHNQVPNHKSHLLAIYIICHLPLVFLSLTSQKFAVLFALFFVRRFLVRSAFECNLVA